MKPGRPFWAFRIRSLQSLFVMSPFSLFDAAVRRLSSRISLRLSPQFPPTSCRFSAARSRLVRRVLCAVMFIVCVWPAAFSAISLAQGSSLEAHAFPLQPAMLGRGDAGVARPDLHVAPLVNPAHLGADWGGGVRVTVAGLAASGRPNRVGDAITFFDENLENIDNLNLPDEEVDRIEEEALDLFARPISLRSTALLPSVTFRAGSVGIGAGAYVTQTARGQAIPDLIAPSFAMFGQLDAIYAVGAGMPLGDTGVRVGMTGRYVDRYVLSYLQTFDDFDSPPLLYGSSIALDIGFQYDVPSVEGLTAALAIYDLVGGNVTYEENDVFDLLDGELPEPGSVERAQDLLDELDGSSTRLGVAYAIPRRLLPSMGPSIVLVDWVSGSSTREGQSFFRKFRIGAETRAGRAQLRAGLSQGLPSVGVGLNVWVVHLDYALFGRQEGLAPSDGASYAHTVQLRVGW